MPNIYISKFISIVDNCQRSSITSRLLRLFLYHLKFVQSWPLSWSLTISRQCMRYARVVFPALFIRIIHKGINQSKFYRFFFSIERKWKRKKEKERKGKILISWFACALCVMQKSVLRFLECKITILGH